MRIVVGQIAAHCERCGGEEFRQGEGLAVLCGACGAGTCQRELLAQIARETVRRADAHLRKARSARQREGKR